MKTVYIVFNDRERIETCTTLFDDLRSVFQDFISIKLCFLSETSPGDISDGDLFLVLYKDRVYQMREYISSLDKVMVMTRTFERKYLDEVYSLPSGTDVLVVNDSEESTIQTTNSLYELGLNHLNLIPYIPSKDMNQDMDKYKHVRVAITPDEEDYAPPFIEHIINVHNRCIDANTFVGIINKLNLNSHLITGNLLTYIQHTTGDTGQRYITESLKDELLKKNLQELQESIIITDNTYTAIYFNAKADRSFNLSAYENMSLESIFAEIEGDLFPPEDYESKLIRFEDTNYIVTKSTVRIAGQVVGYSLRLNTEADIKNMESNLNKQLMKKGLVAKYHFDDILCKSEVMQRSVALAKKVALTDYTILISGESGTGKELFAQSIHNFSPRKDKPFVAINCAALPETLLESELFGYEKGAFTGASPNGKVGLFEQANHGTIFLDEIGDMSLNLQSRLLRVLQEKQIARIGSDRVINLDIRILAATNRDLPEAIKKKEFREDLYYRLCNIPVKLPPLRERKEDIPYLFQFYAEDSFRSITQEQLRMLQAYSWPGNIRELKNAADYFVTLSELPQDITEATAVPPAKSAESAHIASAAVSDIETTVLEIISAHTSENSGIGRVSIQHKLENYGIRISDDKLRKLLNRLASEEKIIIGRGRSGCQIIE